MRVFIAGYSYIKENYFKTFNFYPKREKIFFLLPKIWKAKGGKIRFSPPQKENVYTAKAYFCHSNYPVIGGLSKGFMPAFPFFLIKKRFDIVYSPSEPILLTTLYQGIWSKIFGLKHVIFTWENVSYKNKFKGINLWLKEKLIKMNMVFCDGVVCGNKKAETIIKEYTNKPTAIIPLSGVDADFYRRIPADDFIGKYNLEGKFVYTFAGAIGYRKGIHLIIGAFKDVLNDVPNARLIIAGSGEYEDELKLQITKYKLQNLITFIPWVDANGLRKILSASHVFVYPSLPHGGWEEQFGYSMAEASLMELPVISTLSGSIEDVVADGETGLLVKPNDQKGLEEAMLKLGSDPEFRKKMGQAGRQYIATNFAYPIIANKFYEFFKKVNLHS